MKVVFNRAWARAYWAREDRTSLSGRASRANLADAVCLSRARFGILPGCFEGFPLPANVLLGSRSRRKASSYCDPSVWSTSLPQGSIIGVGGGFYVVSPEFLFLEYARVLDLISLIAFGYELCGTYATDPFSGKVRFGLLPATTQKEIALFLEGLPGVHGAKSARRAIRHVCDNSASPMETALHMHLSLPGQLGGFSLPSSVLNHEVLLDERACQLYLRSSCRCDIYFPRIGYALEYNGQFHDDQREDDFNRAAALELMGIRTTVVTFSQYENLNALSVIARQIAKEHGLSFRKERMGSKRNRLELHDALRSYLFFAKDPFLS